MYKKQHWKSFIHKYLVNQSHDTFNDKCGGEHPSTAVVYIMANGSNQLH